MSSATRSSNGPRRLSGRSRTSWQTCARRSHSSSDCSGSRAPEAGPRHSISPSRSIGHRGAGAAARPLAVHVDAGVAEDLVQPGARVLHRLARERAGEEVQGRLAEGVFGVGAVAVHEVEAAGEQPSSVLCPHVHNGGARVELVHRIRRVHVPETASRGKCESSSSAGIWADGDERPRAAADARRHARIGGGAGADDEMGETLTGRVSSP